MRFGHPSENTLLDLALGLDLDSLARSHLDACSLCRAEVAGLSRTLSTMETWAPPLPSLDLAERTFEKVERFELERAARGLESGRFIVEKLGQFFRLLAGPIPAAALAAALFALGIQPQGRDRTAAKRPEIQAESAGAGMIARLPTKAGASRALVSLPKTPSNSRPPRIEPLDLPPFPARSPNDAPSVPAAKTSIQVAAVGEELPAASGSSVNPLFPGASGGPSSSSRAASAGTAPPRASSGSESDLGSVGVEIKVLGNLIRVETGEKARVLVKVRSSIQMSVEVYGSSGDKAATLLNEAVDPGQREILWDGRDSRGNPVASGVYVLAIHGERFSETVKLIVLK